MMHGMGLLAGRYCYHELFHELPANDQPGASLFGREKHQYCLLYVRTWPDCRYVMLSLHKSQRHGQVPTQKKTLHVVQVYIAQGKRPIYVIP